MRRARPRARGCRRPPRAPGRSPGRTARTGRPPRCSSGCRRGTGRCPPAGRSSSNHSKPGVFSTAPARPRKRSSKRACWSAGTRDGVDLHDTHARCRARRRAPVNPAMRHAGAREHAPHRRPRLRPAGSRPRPAHRHPRGRVRRREDAGADRGLPRGAARRRLGARLGDPGGRRDRRGGARALAGRRRRRRGPCVFVGDLPAPVGEVLVLTAGTSDGAVAAEVAATLAAQRGRLPAGGRRRGGRRAPGAGRRPRASPRPTSSSSSRAWTAPCPAWWPG